MNERIKKIREKFGLSQEELGNALGIGRSAVSRIESGTNTMTETNMKLLCREYGINRQWLETGEGEMLLNDDDALIARVADKYHLDPLDLEAFKLYAKLSASDRKVLMSFSFSLAGKIVENPVLYREYKRARGELPKLSPKDIDVEVAAYRNELELLAKAQADETHDISESSPVLDDVEKLVQTGAAMIREQAISEKKPDVPASSANESAVG